MNNKKIVLDINKKEISFSSLKKGDIFSIVDIIKGKEIYIIKEDKALCNPFLNENLLTNQKSIKLLTIKNGLVSHNLLNTETK